MGTLMSASVKWIGDEIPLLQVVFLRFVIGLSFLLPAVLRNSGTPIFKTHNWLKHIIRALLGMISIGCFYKAVHGMPFVNYATLHHLYPLFIVILSLTWLKERVTVAQWLSIVLGFVGVIIIARPTWDVSATPVMLMLFGSLIAAASDILVKQMTATESSEKIVFYYFGLSAVVLSFAMPSVWVMPGSMSNWIAILILGFSGVALQYCLAQAYRFLNATTVGIWRYSEFLWALLFGLSIWQETPTLSLWIGAVLIFMSSFVVQYFRGKRTANA